MWSVFAKMCLWCPIGFMNLTMGNYPGSGVPFIPSVSAGLPMGVLTRTGTPVPVGPVRMSYGLTTLPLAAALSSKRMKLFSPTMFTPMFPRSRRLSASALKGRILPFLGRSSGMLFFGFAVKSIMGILAFP